MAKDNKPNNDKSTNNDTIPKVTGIGGIFFYLEMLTDQLKINSKYLMETF